MPYCDICGKESYLLSVLIEGAEVNVCEECAIHGKILKRQKMSAEEKKVAEEKIIDFVSGYGNMIKNGREKLGLSQEEFAKKLNEKVTIIQKIETEKIKPTIELAKKFEKFLGVRLIEEIKEGDVKKEIKKEGRTFTFGDFMKV